MELREVKTVNVEVFPSNVKEVLKVEVGEVKVMKVAFVKSTNNVLLWEVKVKVSRVT